MKNLFILGISIFLLASCSSSRQVSSPTSPVGGSGQLSSIQFLDNVSIQPGGGSYKTMLSESSSSYASLNRSNTGAIIEHYPAIRFKYSILENATVEELDNDRLLEFMEQWYGTQYHYGGTSKDGIDCSAFVALLMKSVYSISNLPRISREQFEESRKISKADMREGDLVFFHTLGNHKSVTHVGVYLRNGRFIHASIAGVMISSMQDGYYAQHFAGAGRVSND